MQAKIIWIIIYSSENLELLNQLDTLDNFPLTHKNHYFINLNLMLYCLFYLIIVPILGFLTN